jgi:hypothetical protein
MFNATINNISILFISVSLINDLDNFSVISPSDIVIFNELTLILVIICEFDFAE